MINFHMIFGIENSPAYKNFVLLYCTRENILDCIPDSDYAVLDAHGQRQMFFEQYVEYLQEEYKNI